MSWLEGCSQTEEHKIKRGIYRKGESNFNYGRQQSKKEKEMRSGLFKGKDVLKFHKINCQCSFCRARRGELKGENSIVYGRNIGEKNGAWKGGIAYLPYMGFSKKLREEIRYRDNNTCQFCGGFGRVVHHINYDKEDYRERNLITLCRSHNAEANANRNKWQFLFESLQEIRRI